MNFRTAAFAIALFAAACSTTGEVSRAQQPIGDKTSSSAGAVVLIEGRSGSLMGGYAEFESTEGLVKLTLGVTGAPPGIHAIHLHETGDCSAPDAASAGEHWNPAKVPHGHAGNGPSHMGDIGNLEVKADGTGKLVFVSADWSVGTGGVNDVLGKALIVHARADDFSQPSGNAAGRIGCGVVTHPRREPIAQVR